MALTENQQKRIQNIEMLEMGASLVGLIGGIVYSKRTGGGFIRGAGWGIAGSVGASLVAGLIATPIKNKIIKEAENNPVLMLPDSTTLPDQTGTISELMNQYI
jgi:hypothetical protein